MIGNQAPQIWRFDNANALGFALVDTLGAAVRERLKVKMNPVLALPTGNSMVPFYRIAAKSELLLQTARWNCFNLDEYHPVTKANAALSFRNYMNTHFFSRLAHPVNEQNFLDGSTQDLHAECARYEAKLASQGGIDIALLGIGTNGHIAFNEPGSDYSSRVRGIELHPETLMANFRGDAPFSHAMTLGIGNLLEAKKIFVVALGKNKAGAVSAAIKGTMTKSVPASALQFHSDVTWFIDQEAADQL